ncbi:MAG: GNAT family N-acetyltransferase [Planctomycetota bacterium]|jgi:GNAT superfamily N-acetyltransferase
MEKVPSRYIRAVKGACAGDLADALGDSPETLLAVHALRQGCCRAMVCGALPAFRAALVEVDFLPSEPLGFGPDVEALWELLHRLGDWGCINVPAEAARPMGRLFAQRMSTEVEYVDDVYHVLDVPVAHFRHKDVRLLSIEDLPLLEAAPPEVRGAGFGTTAELLRRGIVACAVVPEGVVSIALMSGRTEHYADIGAHTLEPYRRRGYARAAASLVIERVQDAGLTPVWSAGRRNVASMALAASLGFAECSHRVFVIPQKPRQEEGRKKGQ